MKSATRVVVSSMGMILGLAGIEHGIGEALQGNTAPPGLMFESWPDSEFFRIVGGEPALTIVPNLLITGLLAILVSVILLVWVFRFIDRRHGALVLIGLSIALLLVGGGIAPFILGIIISAAAARINTPLTWWRGHLAMGLRRFLGKLWLWILIACLVAWLMLFPGVPILALFFTLDGPSLILVLFLIALGLLLLSISAALAGDSIQKETEGVKS